MSLKVNEMVVRVSNSLDPNETPNHSSSYPVLSRLHMVFSPDWQDADQFLACWVKLSFECKKKSMFPLLTFADIISFVSNSSDPRSACRSTVFKIHQSEETVNFRLVWVIPSFSEKPLIISHHYKIWGNWRLLPERGTCMSYLHCMSKRTRMESVRYWVPLHQIYPPVTSVTDRSKAEL